MSLPSSNGRGVLGLALSILAATQVFAQGSWTPPRGIPVPPFGIVEEAPSAPSPWTEPIAGFYYVEPGKPGATDSGNPYGTPGRPRLTIPNTLPAGSVVELRGTYDRGHTSPQGLVVQGTAASPVFIRGASPSLRPRITRPWELSGSHAILENLHFADRDGSTAGSLMILAPTDRVAVRRSEFSGNRNDGGVGVGSWNGQITSYVVLHANSIHDNGDVNASYDQDVHGIWVGARVHHLWVVDNEIYRNSGDGIQINAGSASNQASTHHIYVGRNRSHHNKQTGFWAKQATDVVFSENESFGHRSSDSSMGQGMGYQYASERIWFLFNTVHDCEYGIAVMSDSGLGNGKDSYYVGNVIYDIHHAGSYNPNTAWSNAAFMLAGGVNRYVVHNTLHDVDAGVNVPSSTGFVDVVDNVIAEVTEPQGSHVFIESSGTASRSRVAYDLFSPGARFNWGGARYSSLAALQAGKGQGLGALEAEPLFSDTFGRDYRLLSGSPGVDDGAPHPVYSTFQALYGLDISQDAAGAPRTAGPATDMGAYELGEPGPASPPTLSVDGVSVSEGNTGAVTAAFEVSLSRATSEAVTVAYETVDGTASASSDYLYAEGTLSLTPGVTRQTVAVQVTGDTIPEPDETFFLELSGASGADILSGRGIATIHNDDSASLGVSDVMVTEGDVGTVDAVFVVVASAASPHPVSVSYATQGGSAVAGADFLATSGTLTIPGGSTSGAVVVKVLGDTAVEPDEDFFLVLGNPVGATIDDGTAVATIGNDDDVPPPPPAPPAAGVVHVDGKLTRASCTNYDPATRACGPGTGTAYRTLARGAAGRKAGETVYIRQGTYKEALAPTTSGAPGQPITFRPYGSEKVTITGAALDPAIDLSNRSHVVVEGLTITGVVAWLRGENTHHSVVRNCSFTKATAAGSRGGVKLVRADDNRLLDNTLEDGNDLLMLIDSNRNLVSGNTMRNGRHSLWNVLCGNNNVIRRNDFHNELQKVGQVSDCEGSPSDAPVKLSATKYNLIEDNTFSYTPSSGNASPHSGIQYSAQRGLIRRNRFHDTLGPGIAFEIYSDEAKDNTDNRVYHNVFYNTGFAGIQIAAGSAFSGNVFKNNILFKSIFQATDTRWSWYTEVLKGKPVQLLTARLDGFLFEGNDILGNAPGQLYAVTYGDRAGSNPAPKRLKAWQKSKPTLFKGNLQADPRFVDEAARDFRLAAGSPMIDAGAYLTRTASDGAGTALRVEDPTWFFDGFGISGEAGDLIQLEGQAVTARVRGIDLTSGTLTLDRALTWRAGQGVSLAYSGSGPDVGAFERP